MSYALNVYLVWSMVETLASFCQLLFYKKYAYIMSGTHVDTTKMNINTHPLQWYSILLSGTGYETDTDCIMINKIYMQTMSHLPVA